MEIENDGHRKSGRKKNCNGIWMNRLMVIMVLRCLMIMMTKGKWTRHRSAPESDNARERTNYSHKSTERFGTRNSTIYIFTLAIGRTKGVEQFFCLTYFFYSYFAFILPAPQLFRVPSFFRHLPSFSFHCSFAAYLGCPIFFVADFCLIWTMFFIVTSCQKIKWNWTRNDLERQTKSEKVKKDTQKRWTRVKWKIDARIRPNWCEEPLWTQNAPHRRSLAAGLKLNTRYCTQYCSFLFDFRRVFLFRLFIHGMEFLVALLLNCTCLVVIVAWWHHIVNTWRASVDLISIFQTSCYLRTGFAGTRKNGGTSYHAL